MKRLFFALALVACAPQTRSIAASADTSSSNVEPPKIAAAAVAPKDESSETDRVRVDLSPPDDDRKLRSRALLVTEIAQLEMLAQSTSPTSADAAPLLARIGADDAELERVAERDGDGALEAKARAKAIRSFSRLVNEHPDFPQRDVAMFHLGYEYERGGDNAHARMAYLDLLRSMPNSIYVPNAYLSFGEMFFDEGQSDPTKYKLALQAYEAVRKSPPPRNRVYGYACYKQAWALRDLGDRDGARAAFRDTLAFASTFPDLPGSAKLAEAAKTDLASLDDDPPLSE